MEKSAEKIVTQAIELYGCGRYFDAHEILEGLWKRESVYRKTYLHALIQICISLVKVFEKPNARGALEQSQRAAQKLQSLLQSAELTEEGRAIVVKLHAEVEKLHNDLLAGKSADGIMKPELTAAWEDIFTQYDKT